MARVGVNIDPRVKLLLRRLSGLVVRLLINLTNFDTLARRSPSGLGPRDDPCTTFVFDGFSIASAVVSSTP
jgi:hypothetical protein